MELTYNVTLFFNDFVSRTSIFIIALTLSFLFVILVISSSAVTSNAAGSYVFSKKWGTFGAGNSQFNYPVGIAVDSSGNVYVADTSNNRIQKFASDGTFITKWGAAGSGDRQFKLPKGIAVDSSGNVYVADTSNNRIQKFASDGTFITKWGTYGSSEGRLNHPADVAVDSSGNNVYVADASNHRIQKFGSNGNFIRAWGEPGSGAGEFGQEVFGIVVQEGPMGIAVDSSGNVYAVDTGNNRIQKFGATGTFFRAWGDSGSADGRFNFPIGIDVDSSGNVYVADSTNERIQKFTSSGTFMTKWGTEGNGNGQFEKPRDVAVRPASTGPFVSLGNVVYVADGDNHRIQKFVWQLLADPNS